LAAVSQGRFEGGFQDGFINQNQKSAADIASRDFNSLQVQRFLVDTQMYLAPDTSF